MSLDQIGQKLKTARESQGLSLRQIYEKTKIPIGHLQSIDSGHDFDLPEPVYVAGFIKRYADCVGLSGQALSDEYRRQTEENGKWNQPTNSPIIVNTDYFSKNSVDSAPPTFKTIYFNVLWVIVVVGLIYYVSMTQWNRQFNQLDPSLQSLTTKYNAPAINAPASINVPAATPIAAEQPKEPKISISAAQHVWVEVKSVSTGESYFTGFLERGDRRDFQDPQGFRIHAGNGGSLSVDFQGKNEVLGSPGIVAEKVFTSTTTTPVATENPADVKQSAITTSTASNTLKTPTTTHRSSDTRLSSAHETHERLLDDAPSKQYIPGESLGNSTHDVPYRYSEGRLDAD